MLKLAVAIRNARDRDIEAITAIYNESILTSVASFDTEPKTAEDRRAWLAHHDSRHPVLVAERDGQVIGWASLSPWSDRCAYADTAEVSIYLHAAWRGQGLGKELLRALVDRGQAVGLHTLVARITAGNEPSLRLHRALGFQEVGVMREVGYKFGRRHDVYVLQTILPEAAR